MLHNNRLFFYVSKAAKSRPKQCQQHLTPHKQMARPASVIQSLISGAPHTSTPIFSLVLQQCGRALCSHSEVTRAKQSKFWSQCKMEPDGHYYPTRGSFHFSSPIRQAAKYQIANTMPLIKSVLRRAEKVRKKIPEGLARVCLSAELVIIINAIVFCHECGKNVSGFMGVRDYNLNTYKIQVHNGLDRYQFRKKKKKSWK